jgi:hypothetical protein
MAERINDWFVNWRMTRLIMGLVPIKYWKILEWVTDVFSTIHLPDLYISTSVRLLRRQLIWFNLFLGLQIKARLQRRQPWIWQCVSKHWKTFSIPRGLFERWRYTVKNIRTQCQTNERQYCGSIVYNYLNIRRKESLASIVTINWRTKFWIMYSY